MDNELLGAIVDRGTTSSTAVGIAIGTIVGTGTLPAVEPFIIVTLRLVSK